ncbi:MAG: hypothetical protein MUO81_06920 [Thermoplasmata archaeon]|nr:hypothetical protein [Thermoplasmata archaeon]
MNLTGFSSKHLDHEQQLLIRIAAGGCIRTRKDAEYMRDKIVKGGWEKALVPIYRAILVLLGDDSALHTLDPANRSLTEIVLRKMKAYYIGNSDCRCLRNATGGILAPVDTCPVHGRTNENRT